MYDTDPNQLPAASQPEPARRGIVRLFMNDHGIRSGWRLFLYILFVILLVWLFRLVLIAIFGRRLTAETPGRLIASEVSLLIASVLPALIASRLEKRPWGAYGLPSPRRQGATFVVGLLLGFGALSLLMSLIYLFHGVSLGVPVTPATALVRYAIVWAVAFLLVGVVEEFLFRGYSLYTLATGIGFWPAGILLCLVFGGLHLLNPGEDWIGGLDTALTALLFVFSLWRTGTLWFAVGLHASWDWGESFFYGVPDSGQKAIGTLFDPSFHGSKWITGGSVGPEGSVLVFLVTAILFVVVHLLYRTPKWPSQQENLRASDQHACREHQHSA